MSVHGAQKKPMKNLHRFGYIYLFLLSVITLFCDIGSNYEL